MSTSEKVFLAAFDAHADAIFRYCLARLGEREAAKDAVQETFHRTWRWLSKGNRAGNMRALLYRMATNITIDEYRRAKPESLDALEMDPADESARDPFLSAQVSQAITLVRRLEPKYREPLLMRYVDDMPVKEIASVLQETENATSVRIHRAVKQLRDLLKPNHD